MVLNDLVNFLSGFRLLNEVHSSVNGQLRVVSDLTWGVHIMGGGLTQSGGVAHQVWLEALKRAKSKNKNVKRALILGLGGGSIAQIISSLWEGSSIIGVDIDPVIVDLGKKYLGLDKVNPEIIIGDAKDYLLKSNQDFDLICIDTYQGDVFPEKFESKEFVDLVSNHLSKDGMAIFNRLYYADKRKLADRFEKVLRDTFGNVEGVYPQANVLYICSKLK